MGLPSLAHTDKICQKLTREINLVLGGGGAAINKDESWRKPVEGQFLNKGFMQLLKGRVLIIDDISLDVYAVFSET